MKDRKERKNKHVADEDDEEVEKGNQQIECLNRADNKLKHS